MKNLEKYSATQLGKLVNEKKVSPTEILDYFEKRIAERNPSINAFVYTKFDEAKQEAKKLERILASGGKCGPFAGVPFALKDFLPSKKGWSNTHGGVKSLTAIDDADSEFCQAMERAGGIAVGKTNAPAFGFRGTTDNALYGPTSTPFNPKYNSGGSSGGSASAVADGLVPIAEGGDAGGSIRIPAAWCGCVGFKAGIGSIPSVCRPDAWAATHPYCFNGGITRTVEDTIILMSYMIHHNSKDPLSLSNPIDPKKIMKRSLKGLKIGWTTNFLGLFTCEPEVEEIFQKAIKVFAEAGALLSPVFPSLNATRREIEEAWLRGICVDSTIEIELQRQQGYDFLEEHKDELPEEFIYWTKKVREGNILDYYNFNKARTALYDMQDELFKTFDLILCPTASCLPVLNDPNGIVKGPSMINSKPVDPLIGFAQTYIFNMTGNPAISVPAGLSKKGLPIGLQIVGRRFYDSDVLSAAYTYEKLNPWNYDIPYNRSLA